MPLLESSPIGNFVGTSRAGDGRSDYLGFSMRSWHEKGTCRAEQSLDDDATEAVVRAQLRSIRRIAMKLRWWGVPVDDLVQEGAIGLLQSMPRFEPERGVGLLSFSAQGVRRRMFRAIAHDRGQGLTASGSVWGREFFRLRKEIDAATERGRDPVTWLIERLGLTQETARGVVSAHASMLRIEGETVPGWTLDAAPTPEQEILEAEGKRRRARAVRRALLRLSERERWIVEQRWMVDPPATYRSLGGRLGITGERVKQIELRAMQRLRVEVGKDEW